MWCHSVLTVSFIAFIQLNHSAVGQERKMVLDMPTKTATIQLTSPAFKQNEMIPRQYTCEGKDLSVPLQWTDSPGGTQSFALICDDPDAPMGTWVHWVLWNLPADSRELKEGIPAVEKLPNGAGQGMTDFQRVGYGGPCPPPGGPHRYFFKLYALDTRLNFSSHVTKPDLERAMKGHILAEGELVGKYKR